MPQEIDRHADGQKRLAGSGRADAKRQVVFLHGSHIASLAVGARANVPAAIHRGQVLNALPVAPVLDHVENGAHFLGRESALMAKEVAQLLKHPLGLTDAELIPFDVQLVSASDQSHIQNLSNSSQVLVAAAEKEQGFVSVIQGYHHFAHGANQQ